LFGAGFSVLAGAEALHGWEEVASLMNGDKPANQNPNGQAEDDA